MVLHIYTNQQKIESVQNIKFHENWGEVKIKNERDIPIVINAIKKSYELINQAIIDNINTGWYTVTPKEKMGWLDREDEESGEE